MMVHGNFVQINDSGRTSQEFLTFVQNFTGGTVKDNWLGDFYSIGALFGQEYGNNVFSGEFVFSNNSSSSFYNNTFSGNVYNNTFSGEVNSNTFSGYVYNNTFSNEVNNNTFSGQVSSNTFSGDVYNNTFSGNVNSNTFSGDVNSNTFSGDVYNNTFSGQVSNNTFTYTGQLIYVTIVDDLQSKTIDDATYPFLFNPLYKKELLKASNGNNYIRYFDGTADVNTLIP
jgi:hypothetical protein